jgi:hypothetical protein
LSEKEKIVRRGFRHANIGFAVMIVLSIIVIAALSFSSAGKGAMRVGALVSGFIGVAVYITLDTRAERREERRDQ